MELGIGNAMQLGKIGEKVFDIVFGVLLMNYPGSLKR